MEMITVFKNAEGEVTVDKEKVQVGKGKTVVIQWRIDPQSLGGYEFLLPKPIAFEKVDPFSKLVLNRKMIQVTDRNLTPDDQGVIEYALFLKDSTNAIVVVDPEIENLDNGFI